MTQWSGGPALPPGYQPTTPQPLPATTGPGFVLPGYSVPLQGAQTSASPWINPYLGNYLTYGYGPEHAFIDYSKLNLPMPAGAKGPVAIPGTGGLALTQGLPATPPQQGGGSGSGSGSGSNTQTDSGGTSRDSGRERAQGGVTGYDEGGSTERGFRSSVASDHGSESGGPNPSGGQFGVAAEPSSINNLGWGIASAAMPGPVGSVIGLIGNAAQQGVLGPNLQGNQNANINLNPSSYVDFANESPGWLGAATQTAGMARQQHSIDEANQAAAPVGGGTSSDVSHDPGSFGADTSMGHGASADPGSGPGGRGSGDDSGGGWGYMKRGGLLAHANRLKKGGIADAHEIMAPSHSGLVRSDTPGRADKVLTAVPTGSYIFPADVVAHAGDGNTTAGARAIHTFLKKCPSKPAEGPVEYRHVYLSGGEVIGPHEVTRGLGGGSTEKGARYLDRQVLAMRRHAIKHLKGLPAPKR